MTIFDIDMIKESKFFQGISGRDFECICLALSPSVKTYQKKEVVTGQGDMVRQIGIIQEGRIIGTKYHYDGSSQILRLLKPCGIIGLESVSSSFFTSPCMLTAETYCSVVFFTYRDFFSSPQITEPCKKIIWQNVINILADENIRMMYKIDTLSKRTLRERIITYLSIIMEKRGSNTFDIGMTQEQFAQYLCVNRSVLSKELNAMRREQLIDFQKTVYTIPGAGKQHFDSL